MANAYEIIDHAEYALDRGDINLAEYEAIIRPWRDAEPVKHGRWIWNKRLGEWYCSNCDRIMTPYTVEKSDGEYEMAQPFYCGWCGARMEAEE